MSLFDTGIRPAVDAYLQKKSEEERSYGEYWSASSAGYCQRKLIFDRLKVPHVKEQDARKTRVFESGHIFHAWIQGITREAGISVAQEKELQDEDLMVRGHFDDIVLVDGKLQLIDYKTQNSRAFTYQKGKPMSYYHGMQLGTYMYMLRQAPNIISDERFTTAELTDARLIKISKDDLRLSEDQLMWSEELEADVLAYWNTLNQYWRDKKIPPCTCANHEGGFLAREAYNDYWLDGEPCSLKWFDKMKKGGKIKGQ